MKETIVEFGPGRRLVGVLCRPDADRSAGTDGVAIVITNSGIIHRVGANRLHVRLARELASHGYASLRYDLPGIGDSETAGGGQQIAHENVTATRAAFDALQAANVANRFVMFGLCSGADHSFQMSCVDPRVVGAVLIDPTTVFSTSRHRFIRTLYVAARALRPRVLWRLASGRYGITRRVLQPHAEPRRYGFPRALQRADAEEVRTQALEALRVLVERQVRMFLIMTGHNEEVYSYRRQMFDAFPELPGLNEVMRVDRRPSTSHTFGAEAQRRALETDLLDWLTTSGLQPQ